MRVCESTCVCVYSLQALFEGSVDLLQSLGLWLSGAAGLVPGQMGLLGLGLGLFLDH